MCMMVYLASDYELPEIEWQRGKTPLSIRRLAKSEKAYQNIQRASGKPYVYYTGSYLSCGCGFSYGIEKLDSAAYSGCPKKDFDVIQKNFMESESNGRNSVEQLFVYIRNHLKYDQAIELYSYWADNEGKEIIKSEKIDLDTFVLGDSFRFMDECARFHFIKDKL